MQAEQKKEKQETIVNRVIASSMSYPIERHLNYREKNLAYTAKNKSMTDIQCPSILTGDEQNPVVGKKTWHRFMSSSWHRGIEEAKEMHGQFYTTKGGIEETKEMHGEFYTTKGIQMCY